MTFLEVDVQGSDHICRDLMDDLTAIEDRSDDSREFIGNAHSLVITPTGVVIAVNQSTEHADPVDGSAIDTAHDSQHSASQAAPDVSPPPSFRVGLKRFREVLEDWEAFILDDQMDASLSNDDYA